MLTTESQGIDYRGWRIQVVSEAQEFYFECYAPDLLDGCNDGCLYPDWHTALHAACHFIDRELAILAVLDIVNDWFAAGLVSEAEYWNLTDFA